MRIAVTGGTGFLGKYVVEYIKKENNIPVVITRNIIDNSRNDYEYRVSDYSKPDLIDKLFDVDAVVHLAAKRGSQGMISEFHDNEILTQNLYEACCELNITNIVYASSISVYSDEKLLPWTEEQPPAPKLMYGVSKLACEYIGNIYSEKKGLHVKNLRFAHLYGFNEKNNYMINLFMRQAFHHEQLVLHAKSVAKREFLYAKDAAKAVVCALKQSTLSGTFNVGSGEALTNYDVATQINTIFENEGNLLIEDPTADEGISSSYMDSSKAKTILKFSPDYTFSEALAEIRTLMKELDYVPLWY
ncbi:UDP-N-acetylglucosamine 4-epimerase [Geobacillus sp. PA-3]|jgi:UDP-glucose 4-epimerase|uniref:NAD-dependent epimerase/dehydratase family protein n=1 Tax=Geobacillus sp. PA-3 TaxID=1699078 RepID=UPI0006E59ED1|nr:NAD(P)-dependent oxidoreductase [Geobacillus sp. PA-3]KQB91653.1 UDP-N-acetylglucosamine 4-epimerase [Geobacillus sp. PA-3]